MGSHQLMSCQVYYATTSGFGFGVHLQGGGKVVSFGSRAPSEKRKAKKHNPTSFPSQRRGVPMERDVPPSHPELENPENSIRTQDPNPKILDRDSSTQNLKHPAPASLKPHP